MTNITNSKIFIYLTTNIKSYSLICLISVFSLSESVAAISSFKQVEISQQSSINQPNTNREIAEKLIKEGIQLFNQGSRESREQARKKLQEALILWQKIGDRKKLAEIFPIIGRIYDDLSDNLKALEYYNQGLPLLREVGNKSMEASTLNNIGLVYSNLGKNLQALKYLNQALPLRRELGDRSGEAVTLNNIGQVYSDLGNNFKALEYLNQALPLRREVGDRSGEADTLNNIGLVYHNLEEKHKALEYFNQALLLFHAASNRGREAITLNNIGAVYQDLGENDKALEYFKKALLLFRAASNRGGEAATLNNIGRIKDDLGEDKKALEYFNRALPLFHAVGNKGGEAMSLNNIGIVYQDLGENITALEYFNQALTLHRAVGNKGGEATLLNNIGRVYLNLGKHSTANKYFNQALPLHPAIGNRGGEANTLGNIAELERNRGNLKASLANIEASIQIIEELRRKINQEELRTSYFSTKQTFYRFYIDLLMELHKKQPLKGYDARGLHMSERSRARSLVELLNQANAKIHKGVNPELLKKERNLQLSINFKEKSRQNLLQKPDITQAEVQRYTKEIENLLQEYRQLQAKIRSTSPEYASLTNPNPHKDILKLPQIQQQLDQNTMLLQYSLGEKRSYLWMVTNNEFHSYELPTKQEIEKAAQRLSNDLQQPTTSDLAFSSAIQLSKIILAPVANKLSRKRLVIVADGALLTIPFAALANPKNHQYQPLMINHEIINLPSASTIAIQRRHQQNRQMAPKAIAILADPVYNITDERITAKPEKTKIPSRLELENYALKRSAKSLKRNGWARLPGTRKEAQAILKLLPQSQINKAFSFDANYDWATNPALKQYRILHFATHGFVNPDQPELSGIVLSLFDKFGNPKHGYLRLADLFNQDYPAELIVLSACETGLGKNISGEGLVGLTRGLMYAGASRIVASLWQINDQSTAVLMQQFYKQMLQQGKTPASALRAAQRKLWQNPEWRSPYYWAAFIVQGEWN